MRVRVRIVVDVGHDLARGRPEPEVPGPAQPAVRAADQPEAVLAGDGGRGVARAVVDDDHLEVRVLEPPQAFEALADGPGAVVAADDHRDAGPREPLRERDVGEGSPHGGEGGLRSAVAPRQAELPVLDVVAPPVPLVCPREDEEPGAPGRERRPHLPVQHVSLRGRTVPPAVQPELGHDDRAIAGQVVETGQVGLQALPRLEVHVEADHVEERQFQVLGRGVVHVRDERPRVLGLDRAIQLLQVALDATPAVPPDDRAGNLVADRVPENGRMAGACRDARAHALLDGRGAGGVVEEGDVLLPR